MQMHSIFGDELIPIQRKVHRPRLVRTTRQTNLLEPENENLLMILFPEDYSSEDHINLLMKTEVFAWCESDVRHFQWLLLKDVADILSRSNSSLSSVEDTLIWVFSEDKEYDFSIHQCAARMEQDVMYYRNRYVNILAATLRMLRRKKKVSINKIEFYRKCLMKANELMGDIDVKLTPTEASYYR